MAAKNTPEQICEYLRSHPSASAIELSRVLGLTVPNIRHHLEQLIQDGKVENIGKRSGKGRGRPTEYYALSLATRENNLAALSSALMATLIGDLPQTEVELRLRQVAQNLAGVTEVKQGSISVRLNRAVKRLSEMHYQSRWEAHAEGPKFFIERCPYQSLSDAHPEICQIDRFILEALILAPCRQIEHAQPRSLTATHCVFMVEGV
ncbi:MAG TPA: winged helix-turn-helix transcriptional regulator [Anaerolineaceae bacterium]|nr:winged helix-turn-helix transcriptional regulator [Anaerolineaceae bacterium]